MMEEKDLQGIDVATSIGTSRGYVSKLCHGNPVYLTKNGRGDYAIVDMKEFDELRALKSLFSELEKGEASARRDGWISL